MTPTRTIFLTALCSIALPVAAFADVPTTPTNAACSCDQVCAQRESAQALARRQAALRAHRRHEAVAALTTVHVDTHIHRNVAAGCEYQANAVGAYRTNDPSGLRGQNVRLRNLDVTADASLTCAGNVVRRTSQRWVFPNTSPRQVEDLMHQRLALQVPGSSCEWASAYRFEGGNLTSQDVGGNCSHDGSVAALEGFHTSAARPTAIGGGPGSATLRDRKRFGHDGNMIEGVGPFANGPRTGGEARAIDARPGTR